MKVFKDIFLGLVLVSIKSITRKREDLFDEIFFVKVA